METLLHVGLGNALLAAALAVLAAAGGRVCRRPAVRHALWLLVLLKLLTPPFVAIPLPSFAWPENPTVSPAPVLAERAAAPGPAADVAGLVIGEEAGMAPLPAEALPPSLVPVPVPEPSEPAVADPPSRAGPERPTPVASPTIAWEPIVAMLWLGGSVAWLVVAGRRLQRFRRLLRFARPAPPALQDHAHKLATRLGLARCPGVWFLPGPLSPMLWALGGPPRLLLPESLWGRLTVGQQDALLAHELAHLRRRDHWVRGLELAVAGLYWWNPLAWLARQQLREAEEECCDAWVVWALPGVATAYATALVETVAFLSDPRAVLPLAASGAGHVYRLKRRLTMIMREHTHRGLGRAGLLVVLGLGTLLLPLWPTRAQDDRPAAPAVEEPTPTALPLTTGQFAPPAVAAEPGTSVRSSAVAEFRRTANLPPTEQVEEAQEEVGLLKAQLDAKTAERAEAQAMLQKAKRQAQRLEQLYKKGAATDGAAEQAQAEVTVLEARVQGKEAQLSEAQLRLKQAERRLSTLRGQQARTVITPSPAGFSPVLVPPGPAPMKPAAPTADIPPTPRTVVGVRPDSEQRLRDLEKKVAALSKELEALRRKVNEAPAAANVPLPPTLSTPVPPPTLDPRTTPTVPLNKP